MSIRLRANGSFTKVGAIATILLILFAIPVAADVAVQNFMAAEVVTVDACFTKTPGADATSVTGFFSFDDTTTVTDDGVDLLQETSTIRAFAGDRLLYSEAVDFNNACGNDLTLTFLSTDDPAGGLALEPATGGIWDDVNVSFYLADPAGVVVPGLPGTWVEMMNVSGGVVTTPGSVVIADGTTSTMAVVVDTDDAVTIGATGTLRWIAAADHG